MATTNNQASNEKSYFDLHITGVGYVNRIRRVKPTNGPAFLACEIAALHGSSDDVKKTYFNVRVSGKDAQELIARCEQAGTSGKKILIGFRLGDVYPEIFTFSKGKNVGKPGVSLKARLLSVGWIKIDGAYVYQAAKKAADAEPPASEEPDAPGTPSSAADNGAGSALSDGVVGDPF